MSTPDTTQASVAGNTDAPTATVQTFGLSEIVSILGLVSALLVTVFGHDWGIAKNAQAIAELGVILIPVGTSLARSIKHHGAAHANAAVYIAQLSAVGNALLNPDSAHSPAAVAAGVATLNAAVTAPEVDDTPPADEPVDLNDIPQDLPNP